MDLTQVLPVGSAKVLKVVGNKGSTIVEINDPVFTVESGTVEVTNGGDSRSRNLRIVDDTPSVIRVDVNVGEGDKEKLITAHLFLNKKGSLKPAKSVKGKAKTKPTKVVKEKAKPVVKEAVAAISGIANNLVLVLSE
jgi:hypothetical protein